MTPTEAVQYRNELILLVGLMGCYLLTLVALFLANRRPNDSKRENPRNVERVIERVTVIQQQPGEIAPRWDWRGRPAELPATPAALPSPAPPDRPARGRPLPAARRRELGR